MPATIVRNGVVTRSRARPVFRSVPRFQFSSYQFQFSTRRAHMNFDETGSPLNAMRRIRARSPRNASGAQAEAASAGISSRHQLRHAILGRSPRAAPVARAKSCKNWNTFLMLSSSLACCQVKEKIEDHQPRLVRPLISARAAPAKTSTDLTSSRLEPVNKSNQVN